MISFSRRVVSRGASVLPFDAEAAKQLLKGVLSRSARVEQVAPLPAPLCEPVIVEQLHLVRDDEGRDAVAQALLEHDEPAHAAVPVLEGVDGLELGMEGHLYLMTYINGYLSEGGTFGLTVNGDFAIVRDTAGGTLYPAPADPGYDWLSISYDTFGSKLYVNMGIPPGGAGEMGDTGMIVFNDGQQDITGLICVRGYSNENPFPQQ